MKKYYHAYDQESGTTTKTSLSAMSVTKLNASLKKALPFTKSAKRTETLIFPLKGVASFDVEQIRKLDKQITGFGPGSVTWFLAQLSIAGFIVCDSVSKRQQIQGAIDKAADIKHIDDLCGKAGFTRGFYGVSELISMPPRGANKNWDRETLNKVFSQRLLGKNTDHEHIASMTNTALASYNGWDADADAAFTPEVRAALIASILSRVAGTALSDSYLLNLCTGNAAEKSLDREYPQLQMSSLACIPTQKLADTESRIKLINSDSYVVEAGLLSAKEALDAIGLPFDYKSATSVLTSNASSYNGLSWLLNKGISVFAEASLEQLCEYYSVDAALMKPIKQSALALQGIKGLHDYRATIGGSISSFASKLFDRLHEINAKLNTIEALLSEAEALAFPDSLFDDDVERIYWNSGLTPKSAKGFFEGLPLAVKALQQDIHSLSNGAVTPGAIQAVHHGIDSLNDYSAIINIIGNNIRNIQLDLEAARANRTDAVVTLKALADKAVFPGVWLTLADRKSDLNLTIPKLPQIRFEQEAPKARIAQAIHGLEQVNVLAPRLIATLIDASSQSGLNALVSPLVDAFITRLRNQDERHFEIRGIAVDPKSMEVRARRHFLQFWFSFLRNLTPESVELARQQLDSLALLPNQPANGNPRWRYVVHAFMTERKGNLYLSLFARNKHKPYPLDHERLLALDMGNIVHDSLHGIKDGIDHYQVIAKLLEMAGRVNERAMTTREVLLDEWPLPFTLQGVLATAHELQSKADPRQLRRLVSQYAIGIRDASGLAYHDKHFETASLSPITPLKGLVYLPKFTHADGAERLWKPDPRVFNESHKANVAVKHLGVQCGDSIAVGEAISRLIKAGLHRLSKTSPEHVSLRHLLRLMPHSWGSYLPGFTLKQQSDAIQSIEKTFVITKDETSVLSLTNGQSEQLFSLLLPPHYQNRVDDVLTNQRANSPGKLKFKWLYERQSDDSLRLVPDRVELHSVLIQEPAEREDYDSAYLERLVGIDLGERGIGFSVRELSVIGDDVASQVIERGFVPIPALKRLINSVDNYRRKTQACAHIRRHHVDYSKLRKATAGHVIAAIKALMIEFKALPVLEADVVNLSSGSSFLKLVYDLVVSEFTYQNVKTVDKVRENTWLGSYITHPNFQQVTINEKGKETIKPFNLFPGTAVNAAGTSQECSCCHVNAIKRVRDAAANEFAIEKGGQLVVDDDLTLRLFSPTAITNPDSGMEFMGKCIIKKDKLLAHMRKSLRTGKMNKRSKDTSVSQYHCFNAACTHNHPAKKIHADVNAADNIVRRKISRLRVA